MEQCKNIVVDLGNYGIRVEFFCIPSHIGIYLNDVADRLAKEATNKAIVDIESNMTLKAVKRRMRNIRSEWESENVQNILQSGSESIYYYLYVSEHTNVTYGRTLSKVDTLTMRFRLGYKYTW